MGLLQIMSKHSGFLIESCLIYGMTLASGLKLIALLVIEEQGVFGFSYWAVA
jgi:hypothetical protein